MKIQLLKENWKQCGKRRNCSFWAILPFVTMFSHVVCCRGFRKRLYVGKCKQKMVFSVEFQILSVFLHGVWARRCSSPLPRSPSNLDWVSWTLSKILIREDACKLAESWNPFFPLTDPFWYFFQDRTTFFTTFDKGHCDMRHSSFTYGLTVFVGKQHVVWNTGVRKPGNAWEGDMTEKILKRR